MTGQRTQRTGVGSPSEQNSVISPPDPFLAHPETAETFEVVYTGHARVSSHSYYSPEGERLNSDGEQA